MSAGNNFVDLRMANAGIAGDTEDSVWPAFTDIMTVVLMIFLMSLVAFLIRNTQLVDELQTALIEKDQITEKAFLSAEQNSALQAQLTLVREQILSLESSLQTVTGTKDQLQQTLAQREQSVRDLETEIALLTRLRDQLSNSNSDLFKQLDLNRLALSETESTLGATQKSLSETESTLGATQKSLSETESTLGATLKSLSETESTLGATQESLSEKESALGATKQSLSKTELALAEIEAEYSENKNTLNEKISLLLAAKAGLIIARDKSNQKLTDAEAARLELNRKVIALSEQLRMISDKLDSQTSKNEQLDSQLEDQKTIMAGLSSSREELQQKLLEMTNNLSQLQRLYDLRGSVVTDLRAELTGGELKFKSLQEEYDSLGEQYRKLIRPARSPAGKYVVDVYFAKQAGKSVFRMREPEQTEPVTVSLDELETRLGALKEEYQQGLYTRVRIDDQSGIGFNEAWVFTQKMLSQYDYYSNDFSEIPQDSGN